MHEYEFSVAAVLNDWRRRLAAMVQSSRVATATPHRTEEEDDKPTGGQAPPSQLKKAPDRPIDAEDGRTRYLSAPRRGGARRLCLTPLCL